MTAVLLRGLEKNGMAGAWHGHDMASVNQTRPHCANQMRKTHSKPLAARHGRGTAWARHAMFESALRRGFVEDGDLAHGVREEVRPFSKEFYIGGIQRL